jgi:hypothetical protein
MRKKTNSLTTGLRRQHSTATDVDAHQRAYTWSDKAIAYRIAGKIDQVKAAVKKVRRWSLKILALEADAARDTLASARNSAARNCGNASRMRQRQG